MFRYLNVLQKIRGEALKTKNVVGVGVGYKNIGGSRSNNLAMVVLVEKKLPLSELKKRDVIPKMVQGLATDVIEIGKIKMLDARTDKKRPAQPGCSIGNYRITAGTFGAVVKDNRTGEKLILSNNHVLANGSDGFDGRAIIGDPILQPGTYDGGNIGDKVASLVRYIPIERSQSEMQASCPYANGFSMVANAFIKLIRPNYGVKVYKKSEGFNVVDCALARPEQADYIDEAIMDIGKVTGVTEATVGMPVMKSGRTTGVTKGKVLTVGTSLKVEMDENDEVLFKDQVVTDMKSQGGDSGSLVLTGGNKAVGLLFAGSDNATVFNRLKNVMEALEISF